MHPFSVYRIFSFTSGRFNRIYIDSETFFRCSGRMRINEVSEKYNIPQDTLRYYERAGVIPYVKRAPGGYRDYSEEDCSWIELAKCLRDAGLPVEAIIEYRRLFLLGDETIPQRLELLQKQYDDLLAQRKSIDAAIDHLEYKIGRYEIAVKTGKLTWE